MCAVIMVRSGYKEGAVVYCEDKWKQKDIGLQLALGKGLGALKALDIYRRKYYGTLIACIEC